MKYTIEQTEDGRHRLTAQAATGEQFFLGEFGITGRHTMTEPEAAVREVWEAAQRALALANPPRERKRKEAPDEGA